MRFRQQIFITTTIILMTSLLFSGCRKRPDYVLSDSDMESLLVDLILADAYEQSGASAQLPDSIRRNLAQSILLQHGVDRQTLDSTYAWYGRNLDDYEKLYERIDKRLMAMARKSGGNVQKGVVENDIWTLPKHLIFSPIASNEAFVFQLPAGEIQKGESLEWKFFLSSAADADMSIGVDYEDGTSSVTTTSTRGDRRISIKILSDTARQVKRVFGSLKVPRSQMPLWIDSIALLKQPFDSITYLQFRSQRLIHGPKKRPKKADNDSISSSEEAAGFRSREELMNNSANMPGNTHPAGNNSAGKNGKSAPASNSYPVRNSANDKSMKRL